MPRCQLLSSVADLEVTCMLAQKLTAPALEIPFSSIPVMTHNDA